MLGAAFVLSSTGCEWCGSSAGSATEIFLDTRIRQRILEEGGRIYGNKPIYAPDLVDGMF